MFRLIHIYRPGLQLCYDAVAKNLVCVFYIWIISLDVDCSQNVSPRTALNIIQGRSVVKLKPQSLCVWSATVCWRLEGPKCSGFSGHDAELHERHLSTRYRHVCVPAACQAVFCGPWPHLWILCILQKFHTNPLTPNDDYSGRTAPLASKRCILYIYSTNIGTEYFKHGIYCPFFPLQNAVCFINLTYLVPVLFTFYIQVVLKLRK